MKSNRLTALAVLIGLALGATLGAGRLVAYNTVCHMTSLVPDEVMGFCPHPDIADFEHGGIYFDIAGPAIKNLHSADVLFLGNSRMQFAFSTEAVRAFFAARNVRHYLLGFGYNEGARFEVALIRRYHLHPKALIINLDPFFDNGDNYSVPARKILHGNSEREPYALKRAAQLLVKKLCKDGGLLEDDAICHSPRNALYRSTTDGSWNVANFCPQCTSTLFEPSNVAFRWPADNFTRIKRDAADLLDASQVSPACVLVTWVPMPIMGLDQRISEFMRSLDFTVVPPQFEGHRYATIDGNHLDRRSASEWSAAFLHDARPYLEECLR
jgi:hypothetical protein